MRRNHIQPVLTSLLLFTGACLGGSGGGGATDAGDDVTDDTVARCTAVNADAPTDGAWSYDDALPLATVNTWDLATIPAEDQVDYPGGKYRTLTPDGDGDIHPGCSTAGLAYPSSRSSSCGPSIRS